MRAKKSKPDEAMAWARAGWRLLKQDRFAEAQNAFQQSLETDPENYFSVYGMGWVHAKQNDIDEAIKFFDQARIIRPDIWMAYGSLASVYFKKRRLLKGIQFLLKSLLMIVFGKKPSLSEVPLPDD